MPGLILAALAGYGVYLIYTGSSEHPRFSLRTPRGPAASKLVHRWREFVRSSGLDTVSVRESCMVGLVLGTVSGCGAFALFGSPSAAAAAGMFAASTPLASGRARRERRRAEGREAWPRLIEEIRLLTGSAGYSLPTALLTAGRRAPASLQPAFVAATREWRITTDFSRTLNVLKEQLRDPTADAVCETLLVAFEVGGTDIDRRLAALVEDRLLDLQGRKDAAAKQSGVKFARRFVLAVPLGMAAAGLSIGTGRAAYETRLGQFVVLVAISVLAACWAWAGRLMRLPEEERVFPEWAR